MKNLRFNKKRISALAISVVMGTASLIGFNSCSKDDVYDPDVDYTASEITKVFEDDTKLDEAIDSKKALYKGMPITEAVDKLEESLSIVAIAEKNNYSLDYKFKEISELEKLSDEEYEKAEKLSKEEFQQEIYNALGAMGAKDDPSTQLKRMEYKLKHWKMVEHCYRYNKKFVLENADAIVEKYLMDSSKAVIANETNIDGNSINKINIESTSLNKSGDEHDIYVNVGDDTYTVKYNEDGIGEGLNSLYNFQNADKNTLTANDYLEYIDYGKKITMLGARIKTKTLSDDMKILNDISLKDANKKMKRTLKK